MSPIAIACATALSAILLRAAWGDIRARDIPNWIPLTVLLLAPAWWWASGVAPWPGLAWQVGAAVLAFALLAAAWSGGMVGGGDVKLLGALGLWFAPVALLGLFAVMAIAGGAVTLATLVHHRLRAADGAPEVPYAVAIAFAGLWAMAHQILTIPVR